MSEVNDLIAQLDELHPPGAHGWTDTWTGAAWSFHRAAGGPGRHWVIQVSDKRTATGAGLVDALRAAVELGPSCFIVPPRPLEVTGTRIVKNEAHRAYKWRFEADLAEPAPHLVPPGDRRARVGMSNGYSRRLDAATAADRWEEQARLDVDRWDAQWRVIVESGKAFRWAATSYTEEDPLTGEERASVTAQLLGPEA